MGRGKENNTLCDCTVLILGREGANSPIDRCMQMIADIFVFISPQARRQAKDFFCRRSQQAGACRQAVQCSIIPPLEMTPLIFVKFFSRPFFAQEVLLLLTTRGLYGSPDTYSDGINRFLPRRFLFSCLHCPLLHAFSTKHLRNIKCKKGLTGSVWQGATNNHTFPENSNVCLLGGQVRARLIVTVWENFTLTTFSSKALWYSQVLKYGTKNSVAFIRVMASVHEYLNMLKKQRGENWEQNFKEIKKIERKKI